MDKVGLYCGVLQKHLQNVLGRTYSTANVAFLKMITLQTQLTALKRDSIPVLEIVSRVFWQYTSIQVLHYF